VRLIVRGNSQRYFVHLRTRGTRLPWQYYQAGSRWGQTGARCACPSTPSPSGAMLARNAGGGQRLTSLGVVAYGRDHAARIDVAEVGILLTPHRSSGRSGEDLISSIDRSAVTVWIFTSPISAW
jgi:hypothetical protein